VFKTPSWKTCIKSCMKHFVGSKYTNEDSGHLLLIPYFVDYDSRKAFVCSGFSI
jgi:hypothetical protein